MTPRIAIIALESIRNIGEAILAETTAYLIRRICPTARISRVQFCLGGRGDTIAQRGRNFLSRRVGWLAAHTAGTLSFWLTDFSYRIRLGRYFRHAFESVDAAVLAVGMFKYASQDFGSLYGLVARAATRAECPLMLSATSVAQPDSGDWRSRRLRAALQASTWRAVTTRDGTHGIELLRDGYQLPRAVDVRAVGDPALWLPELTGVVRPPESERRVIGVNLVRGGIFETYRGGVTEKRLLEVYRELLAALDARGWEWRLFSNGTRSDEKFGDVLCSTLGIPASRRIPPPSSVAEFARTIASFRAVFGARLHACLTSVAFRVPSVWLNWDDKFVRTAQSLGCSDGLLEVGDLEGSRMVNRLEQAMTKPFDEDKIMTMRQATLDALADFIRKECGNDGP